VTSSVWENSPYVTMNSGAVAELWANTTDSRGGQMEQISPCVRCGSLVFWCDRDNVIRCSQCSPPSAHWLIKERLRATATALPRLQRAMLFVEEQLKGRESIAAGGIIAAARLAKVAPATLTRAREELGFRSVRTRGRWMWIRHT
jgi:DNA-directed RNA polymerase subunit RPC12/RpoP